MALAPQRTNARRYIDANPLEGVDFAKKVELMQTIDAAARARDPRVVQVSASLIGSWSVVEIIRADGHRDLEGLRPADLARLRFDPARHPGFQIRPLNLLTFPKPCL